MLMNLGLIFATFKFALKSMMCLISIFEVICVICILSDPVFVAATLLLGWSGRSCPRERAAG